MAPYRKATTAVILTTGMLSFISYWRAAAIVLCDLASTAYYIGGIVEQSVGKAAPWFIAIIMIFANFVRATYIESCGMFVRAGVYRVVKAAMGGTLAKLAVSALIFDFILTGPISSVAAGQYLAGFLNDLLAHNEINFVLPTNITAMFISISILLYFWRKNVIGIHESSEKALRIMYMTTVMVVTLIAWSVITLILHPQPLPPFMPEIHSEKLGWLQGFDWMRSIGAIGIIIAISHSVLAMSGEETLAQVYREIAKPKLKNMKRAAVIIFITSFCFTAVCSFFAVMIIPDDVRPQYYDNLMSGLTMYLAGPILPKLIFQGVVVVVGALILAGACNTAFVGANGVLNSVAEDGVLADWFRRLHPRYGTTHRIFLTIVIAQIIAVLLCRGDVYLLGEAYAFGVIWSFVTQTLAVAILRFKDKSPREWKVPGNIRIGSVEIPLTLLFMVVVLFVIGATNFFTKTIATTWGVSFVVFFFTVLMISERMQRHREDEKGHFEPVNIRFEKTITPASCGCIHEKRILVAARDPHNLYALRKTLERIDPQTMDIIVFTVDRLSMAEGGELEFEKEQALRERDRELMSNVVKLAERFGTHVIPILVPATDPSFAIAKVAYELDVSEIILGRSEKTTPDVQLERLAFCWGYLAAESGRKVFARILWPQHELHYELS
ncbi:MAG: hypothetical protein A3I05_05990 [Deltaproteobacteria bacterium RIFCSPLOWO2_02_FULL_44_10]|nr:MAG: hypothetical protein A3C46_04805 [Deltaproteobacteria bacterium RIFCSPHIGHO2_02_FULL_44_16]OGQ46153.1 MAG: hypothetical protein A3I05_05990 [Deltaproteobacteria bacterium RIFCSPLOWO2_02_FULL_44_10]